MKCKINLLNLFQRFWNTAGGKALRNFFFFFFICEAPINVETQCLTEIILIFLCGHISPHEKFSKYSQGPNKSMPWHYEHYCSIITGEAQSEIIPSLAGFQVVRWRSICWSSKKKSHCDKTDFLSYSKIHSSAVVAEVQGRRHKW